MTSALQSTKKVTWLSTALLHATVLRLLNGAKSGDTFSRGKLRSRRCHSPRIEAASSLVVEENARKCNHSVGGRVWLLLLAKPPITAREYSFPSLWGMRLRSIGEYLHAAMARRMFDSKRLALNSGVGQGELPGSFRGLGLRERFYYLDP
jgi:hypothetical protein